jgi:hypothetical protein
VGFRGGLVSLTPSNAFARPILQPSPTTIDNPILNDPTIGQFWITVSDGGYVPQLYVSDRVDSFHAPSTSLKLRVVDNLYNGGQQHVGGALYEDGDTSALKGLSYSIAKDNSTPPRPYPELFLLPFVDGTFGASLTDGDDWKVIQGYVCRGLWPATAQNTLCGTNTCVCGANTYWGY